MKKTGICVTLLLIVGVLCVSAFAQPPAGVKVTPYGIQFPLLRPTPYPSPEVDSYQRAFGIRRWLKPLPSDQDDFGDTFAESQNFHKMYSCYGVLGRGEEVFTDLAARWRKTHRGQ